MKVNIVFLNILLILSTSVFAKDQYLARFELKRGVNEVDRGRILVSDKRQAWSKGLKRSYLLSRCQPTESGEMRRLLSTEDHFSGLVVSHQLVKNKVEMTVRRTTVKQRLAEIHALPKGECMELLPVVTTVTKQYSFSSIDGARETWQFSENSIFRVAGELIKEK